MGVEEIPFSELLCEVIDNRGKTCPTADAGIPLIATNCIRNELLYPTYEKVRFVSQHTYSTWFRGHPKPGDILFVNKATPGRVCLVPDPVDFCIAQDMVAVRADPKKIYPKYLFAALRSQIAQERIAQMHVGTLIPHFKKGDFDKLLLPVPSHEVQEFMGDTYFDLSAKIDLNRRMNESLEAMARVLFNSWFVDFDPVRAKAEARDPGLPPNIDALFPDSFEDSDLGKIPAVWTAEELGKFVKFSKGKKPSFTEERARDGLRPVILIETLDDRASAFAPPLGLVEAGIEDTLMVMDGASSGRVETGHEGIVGSTIAKLTTTQRLPGPRFLYYWLKELEPQTRDHLTGTSIPHADKAWIARQMCAVPSSPELADLFENIAGALRNKIETNATQSRTLAAIRDALLPKLISGQLRVNDAERFAEAGT